MTVIPDYPMETYTYDSLFGEGVRGWVHDPEGVTAGGWGLTMTPRDMARFWTAVSEHGYVEWGAYHSGIMGAPVCEENPQPLWLYVVAV